MPEHEYRTGRAPRAEGKSGLGELEASASRGGLSHPGQV